jgi:hypothetical protein
MILSDMDVGPCLLDIVLPIELANRNDGQGHSLWRTVSDKKRFIQTLSAYKRIPFPIPTFVVATRILGVRQQLWDYDSGFRGSWKQLQDAMVDSGWWHDDGPEYITGIYFRQDNRTRESGPAVRVQIWQSGDNPVRVKSPRKTGAASGSKRPKKKSIYRRRGGKKR